MPLPSFLQRLRQRPQSASVADAMPLSSADIEVARVRARRRLVGMVVLVGAGVIGLPWLFETQPRPLANDVQLVSATSARGNGVGTSASRGSSIASVTVPMAAAEPEKAEEKEAAKADVQAARPSAPAGASLRPRTAASAAGVSASKPSPVRVAASQVAAAKPAPVREAIPAAPKPSAPAAAAAPANAASKDAARAKALLEGKPPTASAPAKPSNEADTRYVVQIGAYADAPAAHEVRMKAEKAGVKTYTQAVTTPAGKRIRVRLGPYASKAEADKAVDALRKAGLGGAVLTL